jgi:hypothetical protein
MQRSPEVTYHWQFRPQTLIWLASLSSIGSSISVTLPSASSQYEQPQEPRVVLWTVSWMLGGWSVGMACESAGAQYTGSICARIGDARRPCDPLTTTLTFSAPSVTDLSHSRTRRVSKRVFRTIESVNCTLRCVEDAHMRDGLEWQLCRYGMFAILIGRPNHPTRRGRRRGQSGWHSE